MFSTQDATLVRCLGAPPLVAVKSAIVNGRSVSPFSVRPFGIRLAEECQSKGNRSSPLYTICLNWIHELQFVGFDSKLFYGRHYQIEPYEEHPKSVERNSPITSLCAAQPLRALCFLISLTSLQTTTILAPVSVVWFLLPSFRSRTGAVLCLCPLNPSRGILVILTIIIILCLFGAENRTRTCTISH